MRTFPRWVTWIFLLFLGYVLMVGNYRNTPEERPVVPEQQADAPVKTYPALAAAADGERWKRAIFPDYKSPDDACAPLPLKKNMVGSYAIVLKEGDGTSAGAACGADVPLIIEPVQRDGTVKPGAAMGYTLGLQPEFDALVVGMKPSEERLVMFTPTKRIKALPFAQPNTLQLLRVTYPLDVID